MKKLLITLVIIFSITIIFGETDCEKLFRQGEKYSNNNEFKKAFDLYKKAAEKDHINSMLKIANFYKEGKGVIKNYKQSFKWFKNAAIKGNVSGMYNLGLMYMYGTGIIKNYKKSYEWFLITKYYWNDSYKDRIKLNDIKKNIKKLENILNKSQLNDVQENAQMWVNHHEEF